MRLSQVIKHLQQVQAQHVVDLEVHVYDHLLDGYLALIALDTQASHTVLHINHDLKTHVHKTKVRA